MKVDTGDYAYAFSQVGYGTTGDELTYYAFAALKDGVEGNMAGNTVTSGTVIYDAAYSINEFTNISSNPTIDDIGSHTGSITLVADFTNNTISGTGGQLTVNGTMGTGPDWDGAVTWRGVDGTIDGMITSGQVVGAFQGSSDDIVYAGGIHGTPPIAP